MLRMMRCRMMMLGRMRNEDDNAEHEVEDDEVEDGDVEE